jgi:hypothetical protein
MDGENAENADFHGDNATEYAEFHTVSEFTEGIVERVENSTDHTVQNKGQEIDNDELGSNMEKNAAMDAAIMQMPQNKLEEIAGWFLYFASQVGIVNYWTIADGDTLQIKKEIIQRFQEMKQAEDMGVILEAHMEALQNHAEELLAEKTTSRRWII